MLTKILFDQYQEQVLANPGSYIDSYKQVFQEVQHSVAQYKDKPVEFLYQPMFLTEADIQRFDHLTQQLYRILEKVIQHYLENKSFRAHFGFSPLLEELILKDPGYQTDIPIGRFDIFYDFDRGKFQFCELNTDGSSGMIEQQELARIFKHSLAMEELAKDYDLHDFELFDSWVKIVQNKYAEFSGSEEIPQVAIVDWIEGKIPSEFVEFQKAFERAGCKTVIADPRSLEYREGKLYLQDFRIDCIYRRVVTWEAIENAASIKNFIDAYLNGDVCTIGPFRSQIAHNKIIFALLHDQEKTPFLTEEERQFVKEHIPFTTIFDVNHADLLNYTMENKDQLVLKPMDKYASRGVRVGRDYTPEEWRNIMLGEAKEEYLMQEFCRVPQIPMAFFSEEKVEFINSNYIIGLYMYDGRFQGIYTRSGTKNIIGSIVECFTVPNFVVKSL
ncbi:glutathionylspermidine synthase family protein [Candidatus Formimonas warabiya]|uniref:Glutathionylspermidine synthase pre-ATP-grasp-like domain-containing protein n=1 Tax=Formimonas warabiya TaxID=1761012 RepID=A0A3G1KM75_FORW1|nr:glutathionylspermidine synthase family protein [Candidatus Formimonas warabiya]ATW23561.1 hypothetical protein DCMF_01005 [Candidatus Formimonas warabiya]